MPGKKLPGLAQAIETCIKLHADLPIGAHAHYGFDICLTPNGPVFFESNACCGLFQEILLLRDWFAYPHDKQMAWHCFDKSVVGIPFHLAITKSKKLALGENVEGKYTKDA